MESEKKRKEIKDKRHVGSEYATMRGGSSHATSTLSASLYLIYFIHFFY